MKMPRTKKPADRKKRSTGWKKKPVATIKDLARTSWLTRAAPGGAPM
jgi:hypothetical protein